MDNIKEFEVLVRRKFPYLSSGLMYIMIALFIVLFLWYVVMYPARNASDEMATAYYMLIVPEWLKKFSMIALAGLMIVVPLYRFTRLHKAALLTIGADSLLIKGENVNVTMESRLITKVYISDLTDFARRPKNKMLIVIRHKWRGLIVFRLKNYEDCEEVLDALSKINNAEFMFFDKDIPTMHSEEL